MNNFIPDLKQAHMPSVISQRILPATKARRMPQPISWNTRSELSHLQIGELIELAQWSDLLLYDYINGNMDRLVDMQV